MKIYNLYKENENGTYVGYHGSKHDFSAFSNNYLGKGNDQLGAGFYFFSEEKPAHAYAENGFVYKCELNLENRLSNEELTLDEDFVEKFLELALEKGDTERIEGHLENYMGTFVESMMRYNSDTDVELVNSLESELLRYEPKVFSDIIRNDFGYNGFYDDEQFAYRAYVVFHEDDVQIIEKIPS